MSANILTNAYTLSKVGFQTEMVRYSSNRARSWHLSSLRFFSHVIGSFFSFTNQNLVIQNGSDGKWTLSWHVFACLTFLFPAFLLFFVANRASLTGSCQRYYIGCFNFIYITSFLRRGWGKGWNAWHGICRNVTAQLA